MTDWRAWRSAESQSKTGGPKTGELRPSGEPRTDAFIDAVSETRPLPLRRRPERPKRSERLKRLIQLRLRPRQAEKRLPTDRSERTKRLLWLDRPTFALVVSIAFLVLVIGILFWELAGSSIWDAAAIGDKHEARNAAGAADVRRDVPQAAFARAPADPSSNRDPATGESAKDASVTPAEGEAGHPESRRYTVKPGDTLYRIAMRTYGQKAAIELIRQANGLQDNTIYVGQTLILPPRP